LSNCCSKHAEVFHGEARWARSLSWSQLPSNANRLLPLRVSLLPQSRELRPTGKEKRIRQARHIQLQGAAFAGKRAVSNYFDFGCSKSCIFNRLGNSRWVEGFPWLGKHFRLPLHQIHVCATNAIQALQSLLGSVGSKPSYHSVDFDRGLLDLR